MIVYRQENTEPFMIPGGRYTDAGKIVHLVCIVLELESIIADQVDIKIAPDLLIYLRADGCGQVHYKSAF